jgi:hypothetical protein
MPKTSAHKNWTYDPHPSLRKAQSAVAGMEEKTGRSLEEWLRLVKNEAPGGEKEQAAWLKKEHGLGTNYASWIAARANGTIKISEDGDEYVRQAKDYVDKMYAGPKGHLRTIYDQILTYAKNLGADIRICPCTTFVPIYRNHVIGQIKATTRTRIDLGLALRGSKVPNRLIDTGGFAKKDRITHRIEIGSSDEFDQEAKRWLKTAYDMDA